MNASLASMYHGLGDDNDPDDSGRGEKLSSDCIRVTNVQWGGELLRRAAFDMHLSTCLPFLQIQSISHFDILPA